ncbi:MAG: C10 family peptidase [Bacteroidales bacterium]|jgi:hypothetical protein|nr:C10 family peptidase [Bacteroidales bacterium]
MKKILYLLPFLLASLSIRAQQVSPDEAVRVAQYLFPDQQSGFRIAHQEQRQGNPLYYIINGEGGYAVIAGNKNAVPILAYSQEGNFDNENVISPFLMWINHYADQIASMYKDNMVQDHYQKQWEEVLVNAPGNRSIEEIKPLLEAHWGQGTNYNFYCPKDFNGTNGRAVTGCVATALGQLLHYFRFPESGVGSYAYEHATYGTISADFENAVYNYERMVNVSSKINPDASLLIHHLGVSVDMVYGANSSGMFNHKAAYSLRTHFKFSPETEYLYRDSTMLNWDSVIVAHLEQKIPMYYAGWSVPHIDGHGFICDGYQKDTNSNYYFHFDFGWDTYANGYFYTENLWPAGNNFNLAQELIVNGYPDTSRYNYPNISTTGLRILTAEAGSFTEGSPSFMNYAKNVDYTWIIRPEMTDYDRIQFKISYQIDPSDTIFISCDDASIADRMITADSGSLSLPVDGLEITIRFITSSEEKTKPGFYAEYELEYGDYCSGQILYTQPEGEIEDGSGDTDYHNCTRCRFRIINNRVKNILLTFSEFDTEENEDIFYVYDVSNAGDPVLLETLSGQLTGSMFTYQATRLLFIFETSAHGTAPGWHLNYTTSDVGMDGISLQNTVNIYPNPANTIVKIEMDSDFEVLQISSITGQTISTQQVRDKSMTLDVSSYPAGIYFITLKGNSGNMTKKMIKP